jgi:hypothetical protein
MNITPTEINQFITDNSLVFAPYESEIGTIQVLASGEINPAHADDCYLLELATLQANGEF